MSHVDEGRLHALLDGALAAADPAEAERVELHLAACSDCRARLDEAVRLRDEAAALLGSAQPRAVALPSFEAIRDRADAIAAEEGRAGRDAAAARAHPRRRPALPAAPFRGFAWAATIVLAVGLGWLLNDTVGEPERRALTDMAGEPIGADRPAAVPAGESAPGARPELAAAGNEPERDGSGATPPAVTQGPSPLTGAGAADARAAQPSQEAAAADYDVAMTPAPAPARPEEAEEATLESEAYAVEGRATGELAQRRAETPASSAQRMAQPAAPPPPAADMAGAGADEDEGWRTVSLAEARRAVDGDLLVLDDARVAAAAVRGSGASREVRTLQVTPRGETVTLVQSRAVDEGDAAAESAAAAMPRDGATGVTVRVADWTVTISAAVSRARLEELADDLP